MEGEDGEALRAHYHTRLPTEPARAHAQEEILVRHRQAHAKEFLDCRNLYLS